MSPLKVTAKGRAALAAPRHAPAEGADEDFDATWEKVREAIMAAGGEDTAEMASAREVAEELSTEVMDAAREIFAKNLNQYGGKTYEGAPAGPIVADEPEVPVIVEDRPLSIPAKPSDPYWYDDPKDAAFLEHLILTRQHLGRAFHGSVLITGPAGSGKSEGVPMAVRRLNANNGTQLRFFRMECPTVTDPQKWFGRRELTDEGTVYVKSDLVVAIERGDVILLDEIRRLAAPLINPIMSFLDGTQAVHLSDLNVTIEVNPKTFFIATANEGAQFGGNHRMDWAHRERFPYTIERHFPPRDEEVRILVSHTGVDLDGAQNLVTIAEKARNMYETGDLKSPISTRTLVYAAWLVASGMSEAQALNYTAIPLFDGDANGLAGEASDRTRVAQLLQGRLKTR